MEYHGTALACQQSSSGATACSLIPPRSDPIPGTCQIGFDRRINHHTCQTQVFSCSALMSNFGLALKARLLRSCSSKGSPIGRRPPPSESTLKAGGFGCLLILKTPPSRHGEQAGPRAPRPRRDTPCKESAPCFAISDRSRPDFSKVVFDEIRETPTIGATGRSTRIGVTVFPASPCRPLNRSLARPVGGLDRTMGTIGDDCYLLLLSLSADGFMTLVRYRRNSRRLRNALSRRPEDDAAVPKRLPEPLPSHRTWFVPGRSHGPVSPRAQGSSAPPPLR